MKRRSYKSEVERLEVALAGCDAAALGATKHPAKRGDWAWTPAYQSVLELRRKYEALLRRQAA